MLSPLAVSNRRPDHQGLAAAQETAPRTLRLLQEVGPLLVGEWTQRAGQEPVCLVERLLTGRAMEASSQDGLRSVRAMARKIILLTISLLSKFQ